MLTKEDFTSNEEIDSIQIGDTTVDIVGYVVKVNNNFHSPKSAKFQKFVVNNGHGREVQVTAWNANTRLLRSITEMGTIVHIGSTRAAAIKNKMYNSGNVDFELLIKENSTVDTFGSYEENIKDLIPEEVSIVEAFEKINERIKVEGIIKSEPRKYKSRDHEYTVGSITDCNHKLELRVNCDVSSLHLLKGTSVDITGIMELFPPGPPILRVDNLNQIKIIERERVSFIEILKGYKNKI